LCEFPLVLKGPRYLLRIPLLFPIVYLAAGKLAALSSFALMGMPDFSPLGYFKELHLLPRVMFTLGGGLAIASFFVRSQNLVMGLMGVALVFLAVGLNLLMDSAWRESDPPYPLRFSGHVIVQSLVALAVFVLTFYLAIHLYRYGTLPAILRPVQTVH
jgi:hypothetical protein